ncbi:thioesterase II family protein [Nocardia iowensis]|uniref:Thioesterase TesA n=1 Tax=Nocardia iowensis TaxID=204891 RepID=A0ABX8S2J9_NOCIO|nr:alpha/beta fold hydrolase [Nocardia iowensis]QXN95327.1 alpha/beta fold hydrolase [Nocardia iowensis]
MQHKPGWIRKFHKPDSPGRLPLLIFPHAGAGASAYRALSKAFSAHYDVIIFQYPGRQDRAKEPALTSLQDIAAGAFGEFRMSEYNRDEPIIAFGHSMGALVSFEFVRLALAAGVDVRQLTVSAAVAPSRAEYRTPTPEDDDELLDHLIMLEGINSDVLASREIMRMSLPAIKADHKASEAYRCPANVRVGTRIHAIGGDRDPIVSMADLHGWHQHGDDVEVTMFEGGHFYLNNHVEAMAELLAKDARR